MEVLWFLFDIFQAKHQNMNVTFVTVLLLTEGSTNSRKSSKFRKIELVQRWNVGSSCEECFKCLKPFRIWMSWKQRHMTFEKTTTLLKTNIAPENGWLEDDSFPFGGIGLFSRVNSLLVSGKQIYV